MVFSLQSISSPYTRAYLDKDTLKIRYEIVLNFDLQKYKKKDELVSSLIKHALKDMSVIFKELPSEINFIPEQDMIIYFCEDQGNAAIAVGGWKNNEIFWI